jgi:hypothetical protein
VMGRDEETEGEQTKLGKGKSRGNEGKQNVKGYYVSRGVRS